MSDSVVTREDIFVCLTKMLSRKRREDEDVLAHHHPVSARRVRQSASNYWRKGRGRTR